MGFACQLGYNKITDAATTKDTKFVVQENASDSSDNSYMAASPKDDNCVFSTSNCQAVEVACKFFDTLHI